MRKGFLMLALALVAGVALAVDVRAGDTVALTSPSAGTMIGVGSVVDGTLSLRLVDGFDGFARMTVRSIDGVSVTYDVFVDARGIRVIQGTTVRDLATALGAGGIAVSLQGVDPEAVRDAARSFEGVRGDDDADDGEGEGRDDDDDDGRDDDDDDDDRDDRGDDDGRDDDGEDDRDDDSDDDEDDDDDDLEDDDADRDDDDDEDDDDDDRDD